MKKKKVLIIGCGKFFQTVHLKNILKFYKIEILLDPRSKLIENILKKKKLLEDLQVSTLYLIIKINLI